MMRLLSRLLLTAFVLVGPTAGAAFAVEASELVALKRAGLSDDILIALIQSDGSVFRLSAADIIALHKQGLSERVIDAMLATSRRVPPAQPPAPAPESFQPPPSREPVVVNVYQTNEQRVEQPSAPPELIPIPVPIAVPVFLRPSVRHESAPTFWGFGGKQRPDSWGTRDSWGPRDRTDNRAADRKDEKKDDKKDPIKK